MNNPSHLGEANWPTEGRPSTQHIYTFRVCGATDGQFEYGWHWYLPEGEGTNLAVLATRAYGSLRPAVFTPSFNPPGRAVVGLPTWFWAATAEEGWIRGSSAGGVVAVGAPARLEVDPGDGSGVQMCRWSTTESDVCAVDYARSSAHVGGASPAYTARMRVVYDVSFEQDGAPLEELADVPTELASEWQEVAVPVVEIQSVVTR